MRVHSTKNEVSVSKHEHTTGEELGCPRTSFTMFELAGKAVDVTISVSVVLTVVLVVGVMGVASVLSGFASG